MNYWLLAPDPALRAHVQCYYVAEPRPGGMHDPDFRELELILPDGYAEIVFRGSGCYERWPVHEPDQVERVSTSHVIAGRTASVITRDVENVWLAGVKIDPWLLASLLRKPLDRMAGELVSLADIGNNSLNVLEDKVLSCPSPARIGATLDSFFKAELAKATRIDPMVAYLRQAIDARHGTIGIMDWARVHDCDARTLERRFSRSMGMTPKRYARIIRFRHAYRHILAQPLFKSAVEVNGFFDQSHFLKEFREFTGSSPVMRRTGTETRGFSISDHLIGADNE